MFIYYVKLHFNELRIIDILIYLTINNIYLYIMNNLSLFHLKLYTFVSYIFLLNYIIMLI